MLPVTESKGIRGISCLEREQPYQADSIYEGFTSLYG